VEAQEDLVKALIDGAIMLDRAGGCLQVVLQRRPTPMPNEMVTVAAVCVWMDRTNAKAQPEAPGIEVVEPAEPEVLPQENGEISDELAAALAGELPEDELEVDETDVPESLRRG
jgi:hypothetical protein